jgi:REP-associated tyrosine transposase
VKHGLASRACDWPYSSFHGYVARGALPMDWGGDGWQPAGGSFGE